MPTIDYDSAIRDRAYLLWENAGRPSGLEHEHWAEARRQIEAESIVVEPVAAAAPIVVEDVGDLHEREILRLREALYAPEPFSFALFGDECPKIDLPIIIREAA